MSNRPIAVVKDTDVLMQIDIADTVSQWRSYCKKDVTIFFVKKKLANIVVSA
jgi:hypothetical protein